jgi:hypothetical protein
VKDFVFGKLEKKIPYGTAQIYFLHDLIKPKGNIIVSVKNIAKKA